MGHPVPESMVGEPETTGRYLGEKQHLPDFVANPDVGSGEALTYSK